jgi:SAM-dependent methyltransferase
VPQPVPSTALQARFYPETRVAGFSHVDGSVDFWSRVNALAGPDAQVLDYGAGRGAFIATDPSPYRARLKTLKGRVARVTGCDVDPAVRDNPYLDAADIIDFAAPLPYADAGFDLITANWVFEHVADPRHVAAELMRVLKPGGWICAATANRFGYVALMASLVPNRRHGAVMTKAVPGWQERDVFPTLYRMNTAAKLRDLFGRHGAEVIAYTRSSEPSYHFNSALLYRGFMLLHDLLPRGLQTGLFAFIRKPGGDAAAAF